MTMQSKRMLEGIRVLSSPPADTSVEATTSACLSSKSVVMHHSAGSHNNNAAGCRTRDMRTAQCSRSGRVDHEMQQPWLDG